MAQKKWDTPVEQKRRLVEPDHSQISIGRQCQLLGLSRSGFYYQPQGQSEFNLLLMRLIDQEYTRYPFFGYRKMLRFLRASGYPVSKNRVQRLMQVLGLEAICPGKSTRPSHPRHPVYPYLLRGLKIERTDQVWSCDITYLPLPKGFVYLFAVMD